MTEYLHDGFNNGLGLREHTPEEMAQLLAEIPNSPDLLCSAPTNIPKDNPMDWFKQLSQFVYPFCHGHGRVACASGLYYIATQGKQTRFSRRFAAITDMRCDGNDKVPAGASIPGSMRAAGKYGEVEESEFEYFDCTVPPGGFRNNADINAFVSKHYSNVTPDNVVADAAKIKIQHFVPNLKSYDQMDAGLITGNYACFFGITWDAGLASLRGIEKATKVPSGQVLGGHALATFPWKTFGQERWYPILNSHDGWGVNMRCYMPPSWWDWQIKNSPYGFYLVSDITAPVQARGWDWLDDANSGLVPNNVVW